MTSAIRLPDYDLLGTCARWVRCGGYEKPGPRCVIVECSRGEEVLLRDSWECGQPVEICGVLFEMAVVARRRSWGRPMLVRGVRVG